MSPWRAPLAPDERCEGRQPSHHHQEHPFNARHRPGIALQSILLRWWHRSTPSGAPWPLNYPIPGRVAPGEFRNPPPMQHLPYVVGSSQRAGWPGGHRGDGSGRFRTRSASTAKPALSARRAGTPPESPVTQHAPTKPCITLSGDLGRARPLPWYGPPRPWGRTPLFEHTGHSFRASRLAGAKRGILRTRTSLNNPALVVGYCCRTLHSRQV
jgi:hypothetical protein